MDFEEYRLRGKEVVEYIAEYLSNIRSRRVLPDVKPGYMRKLVPENAPEKGEKWENIFSDIERVIMPGITHWQSPHMHAYFPALNSFPALLAEMIADAINCLGFTWASSPACTELEAIVMDWLAKMIGLPSEFQHRSPQTNGGGVIQGTASEATFVALLAARTEAIRRYKLLHGSMEDSDINGRLVAYCSDQAHSSVEKATLIGLVKLRLLPTDDHLSLRGNTLEMAVKKDKEAGLIPFFVCGTLGTTGACAFDNLPELGAVCVAESIWMHVDAAYAGTAFICPEFRKFMVGIEHAHSLAFNASKWMMVNFECTAMWIKDSTSLHRTFNVDPLYLKHENSGAAIDYMHWQIPLSKRFRALKLWFVIRSFGVEGLQKHIRHGVKLAILFETLMKHDERFEIPAERHLGMVVFRLKGENELTELLLKLLNKSGKLHMVPASFKGKYVIRFTVTSQYTTEEDIRGDFKTIQDTASVVLRDLSLLMNKSKEDELIRDIPEIPEEKAIITSSEETKLERTLSMKRRDFGMSLILSHVPCSPKFINGSFAAIFDNNETILEFARHLTSSDINGRPIRLSPRRGVKLREQAKQHSLDFSTLIPGRRMSTGTARFKQGSLDTKVDDILDSTPDNYYSNGFDEVNGKKNDKEEGKENKDEEEEQELDAQNKQQEEQQQQKQQLQVLQLQQNQLHSVLAASQEKASSFLDKIKKLTPKRLTGETAANNNSSPVKMSNGLHMCPHCGKSIV
ncbi:histidine decarboxylase-like [Octopus vulgaris]|uniref:Histidine decarboxylase n=1 Tax=Octopus vulgaris TaxID=6645 RepID=A0AA36BFU9_OCTVU|nr:histidine decarboxylase-like [Octopus vulgaris]